LDHYSLTVPDLAEAAAFYTCFGLEVRVEGDDAGLYAFGNPHRWAALREGRSKQFGYLTFGIYQADLPAFRSHLDRLNIPCVPPPSGSQSNGIWFHDEEGNLIEMAVRPKSSPLAKSAFGDVSAGTGVAAAPPRSRAPVTRPRRLSHIALYTADVHRKVRFYTKVLGLRLSDHVGDFAAFLHGPHGSEHHMFAMVKSGGPGFHHSSWDVGSINEIGLGAEQMLAKGYDKGWGLGRHVLGSNYFYYATDPWGSHAEYSADMDYIPADCDWQASDHPAEDTYTLWGTEPPAGFMRNFELT
jgi:catechol 2,3-dioxygenase